MLRDTQTQIHIHRIKSTKNKKNWQKINRIHTVSFFSGEKFQLGRTIYTKIIEMTCDFDGIIYRARSIVYSLVDESSIYETHIHMYI